MTNSPPDIDILILGAGPVGMTLALTLKRAGARLGVKLIDRRTRGAYASDPRALALSHGTKQLLEPLNGWNDSAGTAIHQIHVSQSGGFGRTVLSREEQKIPALGYVMRYRDLAGALDACLEERDIIDNAEIVALDADIDGVTVRIKRNGEEQLLRTRLVVHAEGTPGNDPAMYVSDYHQHAVLAEVRPNPPHGHRAWERFTPDGPLALLPLGEDYSVVFTVPPEKADALMAMDDTAFLGSLQQQFGSRIRFAATSPRARYPLALRLRRELTAQRQVWIGNTAQTLHPVSGQGFNLGIRDAFELAGMLLENSAADPGTEFLLSRYARGRQGDRAGSVAFTDGIVRAFSNNIAPLRIGRGFGLMLLDACPLARRFIANRMIWGARGW